MAFTDDVHAVASSLTPSEIPNASDVPSIVASVVKVLEHAGVSVADELLPKPEAAIVDDTAPVAAEAADTGIVDLIHSISERLDRLEHHDQAPPEPVQADVQP